MNLNQGLMIHSQANSFNQKAAPANNDSGRNNCLFNSTSFFSKIVGDGPSAADEPESHRGNEKEEKMEVDLISAKQMEDAKDSGSSRWIQLNFEYVPYSI